MTMMGKEVPVSYLIPLFAVTGAVLVDQTQWENGFHAQAAEIIAGKWLKIWIDFGAVLSAIGLFEAQLSSSAYQILGMAEIGILSKLFGVRSKWFHTPWLGILVSTIITIGVSYMDFTNIISSANFLYSLGMLLEFASFLWLRWKSPSIKRPYRVPLKLPLLVVMCLVPSGFLVLIMVIATKTVYLVSGVMSVAGIGFFLFIKLCKRKKWAAIGPAVTSLAMIMHRKLTSPPIPPAPKAGVQLRVPQMQLATTPLNVSRKCSWRHHPSLSYSSYPASSNGGTTLLSPACLATMTSGTPLPAIVTGGSSFPPLSMVAPT
ncbi:putative polyamine transporter [Glycine soja]|uniref:Putative polyamine transporter n=1 Tax=Glycine soja TaxID=3848 RepID=A0A445JKW4_GLYSO|nr:putative polyamine transporter [Glycine soja]